MQRLLGNYGLLRNIFGKRLDDLLDQLFADLNRLFPQIRKRLYLVNVQIRMATTVELIVDFKNPSVHVKIVCNHLG